VLAICVRADRSGIVLWLLLSAEACELGSDFGIEYLHIGVSYESLDYIGIV
jgi:hypothetical protein